MKTLILSTITLGMFLTSCQTVYYHVWEKLGYEKRDLLQSNVKKVQRDQKNLQEDFKDTLERIRKEYGLKAGNLERVYDRLSHDYEDAKVQKTSIDERVSKMDRIAQDLFREWSGEAKTFSNKTYREDSLEKLESSKARYSQMRKSFDLVQNRLEVVLKKMNERVLYLKHNLNAKAIEGFKVELSQLEGDVQTLIEAIENAIKESEKFSGSL